MGTGACERRKDLGGSQGSYATSCAKRSRSLASRFSRGMPVITGQNFWKHAFQLCALVGSLWAIAPGAQAEIPSQPLGSQVTAASDCGYFTPVLSGDGQWIAETTNFTATYSLPMPHVVTIDRASSLVLTQ